MLSLPKHLYRTVGQIQVARLGCFGRLLLLIPLGSYSQLTFAQNYTPRVYTFVEQMPQLPGSGGTQAISNEILKRLRPSGKFEPNCYRVMVYFEVNSIGKVQHAKITGSSESVAMDSAVLQAVRSLPKLRPGYQGGRPVTVSFTMPFRIATQ